MRGRPSARPAVGTLAFVVTVLVVALFGAPEPVVAQRAEVYRPPVDAPVIDPFRPPDQPWLAGNRGLEYDTAPGLSVHAIGSGLVVFAGPVAGQLYVTVLHGDGIRSSYSYLAATSVTEGDRVRGGQVVGTTGGVPFHLGARLGGAYIDPASLFGSRVGVASVFLVPLGDGPGAARSAGERAAGSGTRRAAPGGPGGRRAVEAAGAVVGLTADLLGDHIGRRIDSALGSLPP